MKQYTFCKLYPAELDALWRLFERTPDFENSITRERFNDLLNAGAIQLWVVPDALTPVAAMVTEIQVRETGNFVNILSFAADNATDREQWFARIKLWAVKNDCKKIRAICKDAQTRLFAKDGFVKYANAIELELTDA